MAAVRRVWSADEDAILRECYATEPHPALAAFVRLPHLSYERIRSHARALGITDRHRKTKPISAVRADVDAADQHPKGWVRPIVCPHCREVLTVPADPRAA